MASPTAKRSISVSLIIGTLLVPMSALAAVWLTDPGTADTPADETVVEVIQATTTLPPAEVVTTGPDDMETACGPEGRTLVDLEADGTITDVQQAALDALRPLCETAGLSLPAAPTPEPVIQTVVAQTAPPATTATTIDDSWDDDHDEHEEDEHEDDEHEDHDDDHEREDDD